MSESRKPFYAFLVFLGVLTFVYLFRYVRRTLIRESLDDCSYHTVLYPVRMPKSTKMYFHFFYNGGKYEGATKLGAEDVGFHWNSSEILNKRYWVEVSCEDYKTFQVNWDISVPDTLKYVPENGWAKIPYGLDTLKR